MNQRRLTRSEFLREGPCLAAGAFVAGVACGGPACGRAPCALQGRQPAGTAGLDPPQRPGRADHHGPAGRLEARELYRLIFEQIPTTQDICRRGNPCPSVWWDGCGESNLKQGNAAYEKGRRELMEAFARLGK